MIAVTGATGHLGRLVLESLRERGTKNVVAFARDPNRATDLGVEVRAADYAKPATLDAALKGVRRLLLISGTELGQRAAQHAAVIDAARRAGVEFVAYTSLAHADRSTLSLAPEHLATERHLADSGLNYAYLRNSWYIENYTGQTGSYLAHGAILGSAGDGRVSAATRADYARAAAAVLTDASVSRATYELGGPAFTLGELAATFAKASGRAIVYRDVSSEEHRHALLGFGLPAPVVDMLVSADAGIRRGDLEVPTTDLERLIGRKPETLAAAVARAVAGHRL